MTDKLLVFITCAIIVALFAYGFDFNGNHWQQCALIICGYMLGNLMTVADYASHDKAEGK